MIAREKGRFITFEGGEGSGKSTQASLLSKHLQTLQIPHILTREPGGTPIAEKIRNLLLEEEVPPLDFISEALLIHAARREHVTKVIWPALNRGEWVICDRFVDSTFAYQAYAQDLGPTLIETLYTLTVGDFMPDLTLILQVPPQEGLARRQSSGKTDRYDEMDVLTHKRIYNAFEGILEKNKERCVGVDGLLSQAQVAKCVQHVIEQYFPLTMH